MEILKYTIPALLVVLVVYILLYQLFKMERQARETELKKTALPLITSTRLRAYERLTLLLERINPNNLLINSTAPDQTCLELQSELLATIRREFDHNTSQQIYVSELLWQEIDEARENLIQLINTCSAQCKADEPATKLANIIVEVFNTPEDTALNAALRMLKDEVKKLL